MKILIADSFPQAQQSTLKEAGHQLTVDSALDGDSLPSAISDHDALIVRSTEVNAATLDAGTELKLVIRAGAGTNTINKAHAAQKNIAVCNVPGANAAAVAELAMGLIIAIDRNIPDNVYDLRNTKWDKKTYSKAHGLLGRNLGIIGVGAIGQALARRAGAFAMNVYCVNKPGRSDAANKAIAECGMQTLESIDDLLGVCDIISLHAPAAPQTRQMVNADFLSKMQDGAMLINTSRGELVDEAALIEAMDSKGIRTGLDVYENEPGSGSGTFISRLAQHPSVYGTHHIGASTAQAQTAVALGVVDIVVGFDNGSITNQVN